MPATQPTFPGAVNGRHLGRLTPTDAMRRKVLPLRPFLKLAGKPIPASDDYATKAAPCLNQMMGNDQEGNCAAVSVAKRVGIVHAYAPGGSVLVATAAEASRLYHEIGGPGDNGLYMQDVYTFMARTGMLLGRARHKILGFAGVDTSDAAQLDAAFHWFGGVCIGVALTQRQYEFSGDSDLWDLDGTRVIGGHAVPLTTRTADRFRLSTWGKQPHVTRRAVANRQWCDEAYVMIGEHWATGGVDVNGVKTDALLAALAALRAGGTPDIPADDNPPTPTPPTPIPAGAAQIVGTVKSWLGTFDVELAVQPRALRGLFENVDWFAVVAVALHIGAAVWRKDYATALRLAIQLLALLGVDPTKIDPAKIRASLESGSHWTSAPEPGKVDANSVG